MNNTLASLVDIQNHLNSIDLDIRKTGNARWIDQKVTPDILCAVAESILNHRENNPNEVFTMRTLWDDPKLNEIMTEVFSKPSLDNASASNEYDKLISQPLLALAYANIISLTKQGSRNFYQLNKNIPILRFIAHRELNAYKYLCLYITKTLKDSGIWQQFDYFLNLQKTRNATSSDFSNLKTDFECFTISSTKINTKVEVGRIFTKVLNPLAFQLGVHGTKRGFLSKNQITMSDIVYNRLNFRDIGKDKNLTREEYESELSKAPAYVHYIEKAKRQVRAHHNGTEVLDGSELTDKTEIHHIFMAHERPMLAAHLENLINLTSNQHRNKAHPINFSHTDPAYQKLCISRKIYAIQASEQLNDGFYNKEKLLEVLNVGLEESIFHSSHNYPEILQILDNVYFERYKIQLNA